MIHFHIFFDRLYCCRWLPFTNTNRDCYHSCWVYLWRQTLVPAEWTFSWFWDIQPAASNVLRCSIHIQLLIIETHTHNHFTALWILTLTTQLSRYQKKHSPTHTYYGHQSSLICFLNLLWSIASSLFNLHAWQSFYNNRRTFKVYYW